MSTGITPLVAALSDAAANTNANADADANANAKSVGRTSSTTGIPTQGTSPDHVTDISLVARTQQGDAGAFEILWERHRRAGFLVAIGYTSRAEAEDLVAEAFTRTYSAILTGGGPSDSFRGYLFSAIRRLAYTTNHRNSRNLPIDDFEPAETTESAESIAMRQLEKDVVVRAFRSLPPRWQEVLWLSVVEGTSHSEIAQRLELTPNAIDQLAFRAREGLREKWVQEHVSSGSSDTTCRWVASQAGAAARGNLSKRDSARLQAHVEACRRCADVINEAERIALRFV
jgi:RNA polymerase sigma factor (sigma-70 family)